MDFDDKGNFSPPKKETGCPEGCPEHQIHRLQYGSYYTIKYHHDRHYNHPLTQKIMMVRGIEPEFSEEFEEPYPVHKPEKYANDICIKMQEVLKKILPNTSFDCIVPVPIHEKHRKECRDVCRTRKNELGTKSHDRELDEQHTRAPLLAETLAEIIRKEPLHKETILLPDVLVRVERSRQFGNVYSSVPERKKTAKNDYEMNPDKAEQIKDKHVLLIDDILVSKATVRVCASLLCGSGAKQVTILCAAESVSHYS